MSSNDDFGSFFDGDRPEVSEPEYEVFRERILEAERLSNKIKLFIILINAIVYFFLNNTGFYSPDKIENRPTLAYIVLGLSFIYSGLSYLIKPSEKYPVMLASYFSYVSDIMFITLWLYATGGFESPFYVMWYAAIVSVALRFNWRIMWVTSIIYMVSYTSLLLVLSHIHSGQQVIELLLRCAYIAVIGHISSLISKETYEQTKEKMQMKNMAKSLLKTQKELEEKTEELEDLTIMLEDKVTQRSKGLDANAKNFGLVLDSIPLLTWTTSPEGKVNYTNRAWTEFFKGEIDGNNLKAFVHPDEIEEVRNKWRNAKDEGAPAEGLFRWKKHDGAWVSMKVTINCLRDEDGEIIMWIGTASEMNR